MDSSQLNGDRRVAIVRGLRTPFVKAGTVFSNLTALDLGRMVVQELVQRAELDPQEIDQVVFGQVIPNLTATSVAREVVLAAGLPRNIEAHTVSRACATSIQALTDAANSIALGREGPGHEVASLPEVETTGSAAAPAGDRGVLHGPYHGRERGEDGQREWNYPRGAGPDCAAVSPKRLGGVARGEV